MTHAPVLDCLRKSLFPLTFEGHFCWIQNSGMAGFFFQPCEHVTPRFPWRRRLRLSTTALGRAPVRISSSAPPWLQIPRGPRFLHFQSPDRSPHGRLGKSHPLQLSCSGGGCTRRADPPLGPPGPGPRKPGPPPRPVRAGDTPLGREVAVLFSPVFKDGGLQALVQHDLRVHLPAAARPCARSSRTYCFTNSLFYH